MSLREWLARAGGAAGVGRRDRELGQELGFHLEMLSPGNPVVSAFRRKGIDGHDSS
jgi:hypothetical protein